MNHRTYDGQRFSPLARINKNNVKGSSSPTRSRSAAAPATSGSQATPLAEDGFLYITDSWGVLYKIDGTSGTVGRIVWRMDPKQDQAAAQPRRRALGQFRDHRRRRPAAHHRDRQGHRQSRVGVRVRRHA